MKSSMIESIAYSPQSGSDGKQGISVSVVIPCYNAEATLEDTLRSVSAQTFRSFEIIAVNDGSTDSTLAILQSFAETEPRLRVLNKANSGVADARNLGIENAASEMIAPIDADDIWHSTYLEKMTSALCTAGRDFAFAYARFRLIDRDSVVLRTPPVYPIKNWCYHQLLLINIVGNGSGILFWRDAAVAVGGYERRLQHDFDAQGCEDWMLQSKFAAQWKVAVVQEYLVGYRKLDNAMSANALRMRRSRIFQLKLLADLYADKSAPYQWALADSYLRLAWQEYRSGNAKRCLVAVRRFLTSTDLPTRTIFAGNFLRQALPVIRNRILGRPRDSGIRAKFADLAPNAGVYAPMVDRFARLIGKAAKLDTGPVVVPGYCAREAATTNGRNHN